MTHYICPGSCGGMSDKAGLCSSVGCDHEKQALVACDCADNKHQKVDPPAEVPAASEKNS